MCQMNPVPDYQPPVGPHKLTEGLLLEGDVRLMIDRSTLKKQLPDYLVRPEVPQRIQIDKKLIPDLKDVIMNEEKGRPMTLREKKVHIDQLKHQYAEERRKLKA